MRATHAIGAGLCAVTLADAGRNGPGWIALATAPYALSYFVAAATLHASRAGAAVQSTLLMLCTMVALTAYRGQLLDHAATPGYDLAVGVVLTLMLVLASGHGVTAMHHVNGAGVPDRERRRRLALHALCGAVAVASLALRADLRQPAALLQRGPTLVAAAISAALPFAASAIFSVSMAVSGLWRRLCGAATLGCGTALSVAYYGGLLAWPLQLDSDWGMLIGLSMAFILVADWAQDDAPRLR